MELQGQNLQMVTEEVADVKTGPMGRVAVTVTGVEVPTSKRTKRGHKVTYARARDPQVGGRGGDDVVGDWGWDPGNNQDMSLPIGRSASANVFNFSVSSRTSKLLRRLTLTPEAVTPGFVTEMVVGGQNLFCNSRPAAGHQFPLLAFNPSLYGMKKYNDANLITPAVTPLQVSGQFLNGQADIVGGVWTTDLISSERLARYEQGQQRSTKGIGQINWAFSLEPVQLAPGATGTLIGRVARKPVDLGQLVIQCSEPGVVNAYLADNIGVSVEDVSVAGNPVFSAGGPVPAGVYAATTTDIRGAFIGKRLTDAGQEVTVTVTNNTAVTLDILGGIWCGRPIPGGRV